MSESITARARRACDFPAADGLLERVRAVVPLVSSRAADAERQRKPDDDALAALEATGVFLSFVPKRFGGYEIDMATYVDVGIAVSEACASTGWITTFYMEHNWLLGLFSDALQEELFAAQPYILAPGSVNPGANSSAVACEGGYRLSGHWRFGTGIVHADWVLLNAQVPTGDALATRLCLLPRKDVEVVDTWFVDGMAATGSLDIIARDVFVPERYVALAVPPIVGAGANATYLMRIPVRPFLALTAAIPAVGAARRAVELFHARLEHRVRFSTGKAQSVSVSGQMRLAHAIADVRAAESRLRALAQDIDAHARGTVRFSSLLLTEMMLAIAHVVRDCRRVVQDVMEGSGASVHFLDQELQRIARDVQVIAAHAVFDLDVHAEQCGKLRVESARPLFEGVRPPVVPA